MCATPDVTQFLRVLQLMSAYIFLTQLTTILFIFYILIPYNLYINYISLFNIGKILFGILSNWTSNPVAVRLY